MAKTALIGAAGAIGNSIAAAARTEGTPYRVVGRDRAHLEKSFAKDSLAEVAVWNPDDPSSVRKACNGIDLLIYLVGVAYNHFELHPVLMEKTLAGAIAEGVKRVLLIGTVYPYGLPRTPRVTEEHPREPHTSKGKMRKAQEDVLLKAHSEGKIKGVILRLPDFYGPGVERSFLHPLFEAAVTERTANLVGPIDVPHEFVYVPDAGLAALALAEKDEAYGRWWNFAGAGAITEREIIDQVSALSGRKQKYRVAGKTTLRLLGLFNPFMRELVEMHYLFTSPILMDDSALHRLLPEVHKTSYADGIRATFDWYRANTARQG